MNNIFINREQGSINTVFNLEREPHAIAIEVLVIKQQLTRLDVFVDPDPSSKKLLLEHPSISALYPCHP